MSVTLTNLIDLVNSESENTKKRGSAEATGDGTTTAFLIAPLGYVVINDSALTVSIDGTPTTDFTMDYTSGILTFTTAPGAGTEVVFNFTYKTWNDTMVTTAINTALHQMFPAAYVPLVDDTVYTDGTSFEYDCDPTVEFVTKVEFRGSPTDGFKLNSRAKYTVFNDGTNAIIRFYSAPSVGQLRLHCICRPQELVTGADTLEADAGLPARFTPAVVSYACYYLMTQKMIPRSRGDVSIATQGTGTLSPRQMNDAANALYLRYQMQMQSLKMPPWSSY